MHVCYLVTEHYAIHSCGQLATLLQKMPQDIDAGDERPDAVRDHEWDDVLRIRVGKKAEGT